MPASSRPSSPDAMLAAVTSSMKQRTGRTLEEWLDAVRAAGVDPLDQGGVRRWLKSEHGVPQNSQWAIADAAARAAGWERPTQAAYTDSQYTGRKAALRPIYDAIEQVCLGLGDDVTIAGRGGYTPFVRRRQFCAVAATATRVDLGLRFVEPPSSPRLVPAKAPGQSTHKVVLTSPEEVDDDVRALLEAAYLQNG